MPEEKITWDNPNVVWDDEANIKAIIERSTASMAPTRFAKSMVEQLDPSEIIKNPALLKDFADQLLSRPINTIAKMFGMPGAKAYKQAKNGDYAGALGTLVGGYGPMALTAFKPSANITPKPILTAEQSAAVGFGKSNKIPMSLGTQTGRSSIQGTQDVLRNLPGAAGIYDKARLAGQEKIQSVLVNMARTEAPAGSATPVLAGESISGNFARRIKRYDSIADSAYSKFRNIANSKTKDIQIGTKVSHPEFMAPKLTKTEPVMAKLAGSVDVRGIKAAIAPIVDQIEGNFLTDLQGEQRAAMIASIKQSSPGYAALKQIQSYQYDFMPLDVADRNLSAIKEIARNTDEISSVRAAMRDRSQGVAASAIPEFQKAIDQAAMDLGGDAANALIIGRKATIKKYELNDTFRKLKTNPYTRLVQDSEEGVKLLTFVKANVPETIPDIARATLEDIIKNNTNNGVLRAAGARRDWYKLPEETKKLLYGERANEIKKGFDLADMMKIDANPSGTARVAALAGTAGATGQALISGNIPELAGIGMGLLTARELARKLYWGQPIKVTIPRPIPGSLAALQAIRNAELNNK